MSSPHTNRRVFDLPVLSILALLGVLVAAVTSLGLSQPSYAANYATHPMSWRDDRCYSTLSAASGILGVLNQPNFGMVNAIVNTPIYDWDQDTDTNLTYRAYNLLGRYAPIGPDGFSSGLRGSLKGKSVGYAENFRFRVTPVPNLVWLAKYIGLQLPNDVGKLQWLAGMPNTVQTVNGSGANPYIANPFIYMQSALIMPSGLPQFQVVTGPLNDLSTAEQGITSPEGLGNFLGLDSIKQISNFQNYQLQGNSGLISALQDGISLDTISRLASEAKSGTRGFEASIESFVGDIANLPGLKQISSYEYGVTGSNPEDNCYESVSSPSSKQVPAYAFSVPGFAVPVTIPGWIFSIVTMLDGKGPSSSGMTAYLGGSINGKAMLDCYGRGVTPTVTPHDTLKIRDFAATFFDGGFGSGLMNTAMFAAIQTAAAAADAASPGAGRAIAEIATSFPAVTSKYETYTSGFAFLFSLQRDTIKLPDYLNNRVVDYTYTSGTQSKTSDINIAFAIGGDGHNQSQNGQQFNPDIYLKLKRPFIVEPTIDLGGSPRRTLDGQEVDVNINTTKYGFNEGSVSLPSADDKYRVDKRTDGGPTYDDNAGASGRSFAQARVYKIVMKPGVVPNAIDADKIDTTKSTQNYYSSTTAPAVSGATDPCGFFAQQLKVGDAGALPSRLSPSNSNANDTMPSPQNIQNQPLGADAAYTCGQIASKDLRMTQSQKSDPLYDQAEKIGAETPAGTKVCFAVYYTNYTNDIKTRGRDWWDGSQMNYNPNYSTPDDRTYLSRAHCIISGYKPSMQVRGGDLMVNGGVYTGTNTKDFLASGSDPKEQRTYGSWAEYGVIASGPVVNLGSGGIYRTGLTPSLEELGFLTFANNRNSSNQRDYGKYAEQVDDGFSRVTRQFTSMSGQASAQVETATSINLLDLQSGVYRLRPNATVDVTASGELPRNRSIILLAQQGTIVNVASDIRIPLQYGSIGDISQVVFAPISDTTGYALNINHTVSQVDAWLINPRGSINTCRTGQPTTSVENIPRATGPCAINNLTVNGPVSADLLLLRRNGGKDQGDDTTIAQSIPGENFNLRPDAYLWAANYVDSAGKKYVTTNAVDLPPRY